MKIIFRDDVAEAPAGQYEAEIREIVKLETAFRGPILRWLFEISAASEYEGCTVVGYTPCSPSVRSELARWVKATGKTAEDSDGCVETDELRGKMVTVMVAEDPKAGTEDGKVVDVTWSARYWAEQ